MRAAWLIFKVLVAIYNGQACQMGQPTDFYGWMNDHPNYVVVKSFETPERGDYWLVKDSHEGQDYELITFIDDISSNLEYTSVFHVKCFRQIN